MPKRQPRWPSIGLNSCSSLHAAGDRLRPTCRSWRPGPPAPRASCGRNSCSGGSSSADRDRPALHRPEQAVEVVALERQQLGQGLFAVLRASSARIISRNSSMWSKNMCSVRHRPIPSAPKAIASRACSGSSALVRTLELAVLRRPSSSAGRTADRPRPARASASW